MQSPDLDVLVIGCGAAGLAAARELDGAGLRVLCVEARDRVGGRIFTIWDSHTEVPIELGAEFVHGRPSEIFDLIRSAGVTAYETGGRTVGGGDSDRVMEDIRRFDGEKADKTLSEFLNSGQYSAEEKHAAIAFIEGFDAASSARVSVAALAQEENASRKVEGERNFRIRDGYDSVLAAAGTPDIRFSSIVESVEWRRGATTVHVRSGLAGERESLHARRALITVPLGVLQAGSIHFDPEPADILAAARAIAFGDVCRIVLRFERPFWEDDPELSGAGFIFADEPVFPTWWTTLPIRTSVITGWTAGPKADALRGKTAAEILSAALITLERVLHRPPARLENWWFHDWQADPFSRGAYSYVPAGALDARRKLAEPVAETLYFAGEATDLLGYGGTVHGAIASGKRAAAQILAAE